MVMGHSSSTTSGGAARPQWSQAVATDGPSALAPLALIDGWGLTMATPDEAIGAIIVGARRSESFSVTTLNLDHLVKLRRDATFRSAYRRASIVTADGAPVVWLARSQGVKVERTTGADLVVPLMIAAAHHKVPVYLFGSSEEVLQKSASALRTITGGTLNICGVAAPEQGFDASGPGADAAIAAIQAVGARIVLVALGAPKQEIFAARGVAAATGAGFVCIGAALDFISGAQTRAPRLLRTYGLEWAWRLATDPRRLTKRYLLCVGLLIDLVIVQPLRQKLPRRKNV
jgi:exopolysaccharide biosynthesis WecB/TagA/CpsF family protein